MKEKVDFISLRKKKEQLLKQMKPNIKKVDKTDPQLNFMLNGFVKDNCSEYKKLI